MDLHVRSGMEVIPRAECLRLLAGQRVGRLGFLAGDQPMVLPVNYGVEGGVVVFRTGEGAKLEGARKGKVAFEVDDYGPDACTGWSVVVQGVAEDITGTDDWFDERLQAIVGPACIPDFADHLVRITPSRISGRRFPTSAPSRRTRRIVLPSWVPGDPGHRLASLTRRRAGVAPRP